MASAERGRRDPPGPGRRRQRVDVGMCSDVLAGELVGIRHFKLDYPPGDKAPASLRRRSRHSRPNCACGWRGRAVPGSLQPEITAVPWVFTAHNVPPAGAFSRDSTATPRCIRLFRNALAWPNVWTWSQS